MCPILTATQQSSNAKRTYVTLFTHTHTHTHKVQKTHHSKPEANEFLNRQPKAEQFNCAQRAHSNFLENAPQTIISALVAGLKYPQLTVAVTGAWLIFRALFLYGYVFSGKPQGKGRLIGGFFWFAQGALWGMCVFGVARDLISF